ncbi:hypothetical protein EDC01DRAFT_682889 [Geopyxis carbonaria]|nr:hypothetical protein EDC01DRAFT_682889 [Geopyxis carbonaria]
MMYPRCCRCTLTSPARCQSQSRFTLSVAMQLPDTRALWSILFCSFLFFYLFIYFFRRLHAVTSRESIYGTLLSGTASNDGAASAMTSPSSPSRPIARDLFPCARVWSAAVRTADRGLYGEASMRLLKADKIRPLHTCPMPLCPSTLSTCNRDAQVQQGGSWSRCQDVFDWVRDCLAADRDRSGCDDPG